MSGDYDFGDFDIIEGRDGEPIGQVHPSGEVYDLHADDDLGHIRSDGTLVDGDGEPLGWIRRNDDDHGDSVAEDREFPDLSLGNYEGYAGESGNLSSFSQSNASLKRIEVAQAIIKTRDPQGLYKLINPYTFLMIIILIQVLYSLSCWGLGTLLF